MLVKVLGVIDLIAGFILILTILVNIPTQILIIFGIVLIIKSLSGFLKFFGSWIDFLTGILFFILIFISIPIWISIIFVVLIIQKGVFSFF